MAGCYKSRGSFPVYHASKVQKGWNAPSRPKKKKKMAKKVIKSRFMPSYVPAINPTGWPLISALRLKGFRPSTKIKSGFCGRSLQDSTLCHGRRIQGRWQRGGGQRGGGRGAAPSCKFVRAKRLWFRQKHLEKVKKNIQLVIKEVSRIKIFGITNLVSLDARIVNI